MQTERVNFDRYRDPAFESRFVRYESVKDWVRRAIENSGSLSASVIGYSAENREIHRLSIGHGKIPVLLWSQMHGDESTATMALFDVLNFLTNRDEYNDFRDEVLQCCTLHFIPMLNPDGAEMCQRRNAQGIDINRDFLSLQSPEARLLTVQQELLRPVFAFNLHDQDSLWSVAGSRQPALISLLAPPAEQSLNVTSSMSTAIRIIASLYSFLEEEIPGKIGRWKDEYEPRAVGETFQKAGIATILIESGGYNDEASKQYVRKLNFDALLYAFRLIASGETQNEAVAIKIYEEIPLNTKEIFHIIIRNLRFRTAGGIISLDVGLNHESVDSREERCFVIADIGDLSTFSAYNEIDALAAELESENLELNAKANFRIRSRVGNVINIKDGIIKELNFVS